MTGGWRMAWLLCFVAAAQTPDSNLRDGLLALQRGDIAHAREYLEKATTLDPAEKRAWAALAQIYWRNGERNLATDAARRVERLGADDPAMQHALALYYSETGEAAAAANWERRYAAARPSDPQAAAHAAALSIGAGQAPEAVACAQAALRLQDTPALHHLLGQAYAAANQPAQAVRELRAAAVGDPQVEAFAVDLGQLQLRSGDFAGALTTFDQGRRRFPSSAQMELAYGVAAYGQRRFTEAIDSFLRVTALDPSVEQPYVFLGRLLDQAADRLPRITAADAAWEKAEPRNPLPPCLYAKALAAAGDEPARIEAELRRSIELSGGYWESHFDLGVLMEKNGDWRAAAAELKRAIDLNPKHAPAHFQLARAYDKLGQRELAQSERAEHERLTAAETGVGEKPAR